MANDLMTAPPAGATPAADDLGLHRGADLPSDAFERRFKDG